MTADPNPDLATAAAPRPKIWKTALFLAGSVAFGGVAVVLWNRRELARIREQAGIPAPEPEPLSEEDVY